MSLLEYSVVIKSTGILSLIGTQMLFVFTPWKIYGPQRGSLMAKVIGIYISVSPHLSPRLVIAQRTHI